MVVSSRNLLFQGVYFQGYFKEGNNLLLSLNNPRLFKPLVVGAPCWSRDFHALALGALTWWAAKLWCCVWWMKWLNKPITVQWDDCIFAHMNGWFLMVNVGLFTIYTWAKEQKTTHFFFKEKSNHIQPMFILNTKVDLLTAICLTKGWKKKLVFGGVGWGDMVGHLSISSLIQLLCTVSYQVLDGFSLPFPHGSWDQACVPVPASWWHSGRLTRGL